MPGKGTREISIKMHIYVEVEDGEITTKELEDKVYSLVGLIEKEYNVSCQVHEFEIN